jgi:hypothetical protein
MADEGCVAMCRRRIARQARTSATATVPGITSGTATGIGENRTIQVRAGNLYDCFDNYTVHLDSALSRADPVSVDVDMPLTVANNAASPALPVPLIWR